MLDKTVTDMSEWTDGQERQTPPCPLVREERECQDDVRRP